MASIRQIVSRGGDVAVWNASTKIPLEYEIIIRKKSTGGYELCIGDGVKRGKDLDPIQSGGGSGPGLPDLEPLTVLANLDPDTPATASEYRLSPDPNDPTALNLLTSMGALGDSDRTALQTRIGNLSTTEIDSGGLRGVLDRFTGLRSPSPLVVTGTTALLSPTVSVGSPLPADVALFDRVSSANIPPNSYIGSIAANRLSFTLTAEMFNLSSTPAPINATVAGAKSTTIQRISNTAFGHYLSGILSQNVYNGVYPLRSTPNDLPTNAITGDTTELRVKDGIISVRAAQVQSGAWEKLNDQADLVLYHRQVVAPITPTAHNVWTTQPATGTEFLEEGLLGVPLRHRFSLTIPDGNYTQFLIGIDTLIVAGSTSSKLFVEFWDSGLATPAWVDITTTRVEVPLTGALDTPKTSSWGTLTPAAMFLAALNSNGKSIRCRIMGNSSNGTGNPEFGNVWVMLK
jgi:hypothetical protein